MTRVGTARLPEGALDMSDEDYDSLWADLRSWRAANPTANRAQVRARVRSRVVGRIPPRGAVSDHWLLVVALSNDVQVEQTPDERAWLVDAFWDDIPTDKRRGRRPDVSVRGGGGRGAVR